MNTKWLKTKTGLVNMDLVASIVLLADDERGFVEARLADGHLLTIFAGTPAECEEASDEIERGLISNGIFISLRGLTSTQLPPPEYSEDDYEQQLAEIAAERHLPHVRLIGDDDDIPF